MFSLLPFSIPDNLELTRAPYAKSQSPLDADINDREDMPGAFVKGRWTSNTTRYFQKHKLEALYLYPEKEEGVEYLADLPQLRTLHITTTNAIDLSPVEALTNLENLNLNCNTKTSLDFTKLINLRYCFLRWWQQAKGILDCDYLEYLYLDQFKPKSELSFIHMPRLKRLAIGNSNIESIESLTGLKNLKKLQLLNCRRIDSLNGIEVFEQLNWLAVSGSKKLQSIDPVKTLRHVEVLDFSDSGDIETLKPLQSLSTLRAFAYAGSKNKFVDGDLSYLEKLPNLSMLMFGHRRHYSHKLVKQWNWQNFYHPDVLLEKN